MITTIPDRERTLQAEVDAMKEELERVEASNRIRGDELARLRAVEPIGWYDSESGKTVFGVKPTSKPWSPSAQWLPFFAAPPAQPADYIHSCSYYCDRPACVKRQRDELRDAAQPAFDIEQMIAACLPGGYSCDPQQVADAIRQYFAAPPAPAQEPQWINVADRMPDPGVVVLAFHKNSAGHGRRIRAAWVPAKTEEAHSESDFGEYDEETDCYYAPEGWYEQMEHWPEYTSCMVCGVEITHWMPLPAAPKASHDPR